MTWPSRPRRRILRALDFITVLPRVTWPSPAMATRPLRRTETMVVAWKVVGFWLGSMTASVVEPHGWGPRGGVQALGTECSAGAPVGCRFQSLHDIRFVETAPDPPPHAFNVSPTTSVSRADVPRRIRWPGAGSRGGYRSASSRYRRGRAVPVRRA